MGFEETPKLINPFVGILSRFSHPDWNIVFVTKGQVLRDRFLIYGHPVLVKSIGELWVERWSKDLEVRIPLRAAKKDDVILIHLTDGGNDPAIERLQLRVQQIRIEVVCDRLVKQIVSNHRPFVLVTSRYFSPELDGQ